MEPRNIYRPISDGREKYHNQKLLKIAHPKKIEWGCITVTIVDLLTIHYIHNFYYYCNSYHVVEKLRSVLCNNLIQYTLFVELKKNINHLLMTKSYKIARGCIESNM